MQFFGEKQEKMKRFSPLCMLLSDCVQTNARFACQKKAQPVTHCQTTLYSSSVGALSSRV
jgi:hypothetical protein